MTDAEFELLKQEEIKKQQDISDLYNQRIEGEYNEELENSISLLLEELNLLRIQISQEELRRRLEKEAKIEELKSLYASIKDPYYAMAKLNDGKNNPAEYLDEAIQSMDDTVLKALKKAWKDDEEKLLEEDDINQIEMLIKEIPYSLLTNDIKSHPKVIKYFNRVDKKIVKLKNKLGL